MSHYVMTVADEPLPGTRMTQQVVLSLLCRTNRYLHYGIKFWFGTSAVMALTLALSAEVPAFQAWRPLYLILTVVIVCSQKVDTTLSKGVLRLVASVVGGAYGNLLLPLLLH